MRWNRTHGPTTRLMMVAAALLIPLLGGCSKQTRPKKSLDETTRNSLRSVQKQPGMAKAKSAHALELFQAQQAAYALIGGDLVEEDTNLAQQSAEQRFRQLQTDLHQPRNGRIVGGKPADQYSDRSRFRYQVALVYTGYNSPKDGQFCGGSLIDSRWVLTAAHCTADTETTQLQPQDLQVFVGSYKLSQGGTLLPVARIFTHEQYNHDVSHPMHDVALLELSSPVPGITPIPLADDNEEQVLQKYSNNATISGWGDTSEGTGLGSDDLLWARVGLVAVGVCNDRTHYNGLVTDEMICAAKSHADSCQGDSGGPLVMSDSHGQWFQEGIVSWGIGCAEPGKPGVYARVPRYVSWIKNHLVERTQAGTGNGSSALLAKTTLVPR
jgi:secreted trypsin-like serine protease